MAIRILAGGALSGSEARSPMGVTSVAPIVSGASYTADVAAARRLVPVVQAGQADRMARMRC